MGDAICLSHRHIEESLARQEHILNEFRKDNAKNALVMSGFMSEMTTYVKDLAYLKEKRETASQDCEDKRAELWTVIKAITSRLDKNYKTIAVVASIASSLGAFVSWAITTYLDQFPPTP